MFSIWESHLHTFSVLSSEGRNSRQKLNSELLDEEMLFEKAVMIRLNMFALLLNKTFPHSVPFSQVTLNKSSVLWFWCFSGAVVTPINLSVFCYLFLYWYMAAKRLASEMQIKEVEKMWCVMHCSDLHGHRRASWCILWLHLGVGRIERSFIHQLVVKLQGLQNLHIQFW